MRIGITGPTSVKRVCELLSIKEEEFFFKVRQLAEHIAQTDHSVVIVPFKNSVPEFFSEVYVEEDGKDVTGIVPEDDKEFGISLLNRAACDKVINCGKWSNVPSEFLKNIDVLMVVGLGRNAFIHLGYTKVYEPKRIIILEDFISSRLPSELENGLKLEYVKLDDISEII